MRLIDCGQAAVSFGAVPSDRNLALIDVSPSPDVWVAAVPVVIRATVKNFGSLPVKNVPLAVSVIQYAADGVVDPDRLDSGSTESLPSPVIASIPAGGEVTKTFQVYIPSPGTHAVTVALPTDSLPTDNSRTCTLPLTDGQRVLIVDGDVDRRGSYFIASVLDPGSQVRTGAVPEIQSPDYLRDATADSLSAYRAVYICDVPQIPDNAAAALSEYVRRGGGVAMFVGPGTDAQNYNQVLLGGDRQLLPGKLAGVLPLEPESISSGDTGGGSDVVLSESTSVITDPIRAVGDSALSLVGLSDSWTLQRRAIGEWESTDSRETGVDGDRSNAADTDPTPAQTTRPTTILRRRDGLPLVTSQELGDGQIITVLTGLTGEWTNWAGDPTFVVFLLQSNAELWSSAAPMVNRLISDPLKISSSIPGPIEATFYPPSNSPPRAGIEFVIDPDSADQEIERTAGNVSAGATASIDPAKRFIENDPSFESLLSPGLGELVQIDADGSSSVRPIATVIVPTDSDLKRSDSAAVLQALQPIRATFVTSSAWSEENSRSASSTLSLVLLGILAAMLLIEQTLAAWASYHSRPTPIAAAATHGAA